MNILEMWALTNVFMTVVAFVVIALIMLFVIWLEYRESKCKRGKK